MGRQEFMKNLMICSAYGLLSILQTLNSRTLYKSLNFDYYSFVNLFSQIDFCNSKDRHHNHFRMQWRPFTIFEQTFQSSSIFCVYDSQHRFVILLHHHYAIGSISIFQKTSSFVYRRYFLSSKPFRNH